MLSYPVRPSTGSRRPGLSTQVVLGAGVAAVEKGFYDPDNIAVVDVDGTRAMELRVVPGKANGTGKPSGACPEPYLSVEARS